MLETLAVPMTASRYRLPPTTPVAPSVATTVRVVLADPLTIFRDAVHATLTAAGWFTVVGIACDGDDAVRSVREHRPDVLVLDLAVPPAGGIDVLRRLTEENLGVQTAVFADKATHEEVATALTLGARGVMTRELAPPLLFECLRTVTHGHCWIGNDYLRDLGEAMHPRVRSKSAPAPAETLTPREIEVIAALMDGATNRDIGRTLGISEQTVKNHLRNVFDKLGVSSRVELALQCAHRHEERRQPPAHLSRLPQASSR